MTPFNRRSQKYPMITGLYNRHRDCSSRSTRPLDEPRSVNNTEKDSKMQPVTLVIEAHLDQETISEIEMMRSMRLEHYRAMAQDPASALIKLQNSGLAEETSEVQLISKALQQTLDIEERLRNPTVIYEDELLMYVQTYAEVKTST
jgi:hypothetical protein